MKTAKLFKNGHSQAVRLPKDCRFDGTEVLVKKVGNAVVLMPVEHSWETLFASLKMFSADFMLERNQPEMQERDEWLD